MEFEIYHNKPSENQDAVDQDTIDREAGGVPISEYEPQQLSAYSDTMSDEMAGRTQSGDETQRQSYDYGLGQRLLDLLQGSDHAVVNYGDIANHLWGVDIATLSAEETAFYKQKIHVLKDRLPSMEGRIRAVTDHGYVYESSDASRGVLDLSERQIDLTTGQVYGQGGEQLASLSPDDLALLTYMQDNSGKDLSYEEMIQRMYGVNLDTVSGQEQHKMKARLRKRIGVLRSKIEDNIQNPKYIRGSAVPNKSYIFSV